MGFFLFVLVCLCFHQTSLKKVLHRVVAEKGNVLQMGDKIMK